MSSVSRNRPRVVVVGIGNLLLKDEGVGVHVVQVLEKVPLPAEVNLEIIDGGTSPHILPLIEGADKLIILDAAKGGGEPGAIYRFSPEAIELQHRGIASVHDTGLLDMLRIMRTLGRQPKETIVIGVEPKEIEYGLELSAEVERRIPEVVALVLEEMALNR